MTDKTIILITGANSGVGYETARIIAAASPTYHIIVAARSVSKGEKALSELRAKVPSGSLSLLELDVTSSTSISSAVSSTTEQFGRLDVLINNAGIVNQDPDLSTQLQKTFAANTFGPALLTEALVPLLKKSAAPRIINVSSGLGSITVRSDSKDPYYRLPATSYRMSKAALNMLSACQLADFSSWGAKVWSFDPGYVITNLTGEEDKPNRIKNGAESAETSAVGILEILEGKRDGEVGSFVARNGESYAW